MVEKHALAARIMVYLIHTVNPTVSGRVGRGYEVGIEGVEVTVRLWLSRCHATVSCGAICRYLPVCFDRQAWGWCCSVP